MLKSCDDGKGRSENVDGKEGVDEDDEVRLEEKLCDHVSLESKQLHELPLKLLAEIPQGGLGPLSLSLKRNRLTVIGTELYKLSRLHTLDVSRNRLHTISPGISQLCSLERLVLLGNKLKLSTIPLDELVNMPTLKHIDFRYNEKLEKQESSKTIRSLFGDRALIADGNAKKSVNKAESACDRDGDSLRDQLAPWSTPQLRLRLETVFGVATDPAVVDRNEVMDMLLQCYERDGPRIIVQAQGKPVDDLLISQLTDCLRSLAWPTTTRERPKVQAFKYFTLQRPDTKFTVENGAKAKLNAVKLKRYEEIWELLNKTLATVDPEFAATYTGVALTYGFTDSPHIDTENIGPFYAISFGDFEGGGCIAVESGPKEVTHVSTYHRLALVDGRFPHWVTKYTGERYSIIYYRTVGDVTPVTRAVLC